MTHPDLTEKTGPAYRREALIAAQARTWQAVNEIGRRVRPGTRESEAKAIAHEVLVELGHDRRWHPNIVRVEHLGRDEGTLYIAMEYVQGLDLRELLRRCAKKRVPSLRTRQKWMASRSATASGMAMQCRT